MAEVDCVARMLQFKQCRPAVEFDLKPNLFTARVPGHEEPFQAMSLCRLMDQIERPLWPSTNSSNPTGS